MKSLTICIVIITLSCISSKACSQETLKQEATNKMKEDNCLTATINLEECTVKYERGYFCSLINNTVDMFKKTCGSDPMKCIDTAIKVAGWVDSLGQQNSANVKQKELNNK